MLQVKKPIEGVFITILISKRMPADKVQFEPSMLQVVTDVARAAKAEDVIIALGAGDVSSLSAPILDARLHQPIRCFGFKVATFKISKNT
jgi:UDP-N-acetylmuramate-alanine ligase